MAGTITQAYNTLGFIKTAVFTCTGDSDGGSYPDTVLTEPLDGFLLVLKTNPGATAPTDEYDITLIDGDGFDALQGVGADRDEATTELAPIVIGETVKHPVVAPSDTLTLKIANNSVNSAGIVITIYYSKAN